MPNVRAPGRASLSRSIALTGVTSFVILFVNFSTGLVVARALGPSGRGETAALGTLNLLIGYLAVLGINEGMSYLAAKRPEEMSRIIGTSLALVAVLGTLGVVVAQLLLPVVLGAQDEALISIGRYFLLSVYLGVASALLQGILAGNQDFSGSNLSRVLQPVTYLAGLVLLAVTGTLTVTTVLAAGAVSSGLTVIVSVQRLHRFVGIGKPSLAVARSAAAFGMRVQGSVLGGLGTARLDLLLMPTILPAAAIGLYSVATNSSSMMILLAGSLGSVVLPVAARRGDEAGAVLVARMLRLVLAFGVVLGLPLLLLAPQLLRFVYGSDFVDAATALRVLTPGMLFAMGGRVLEGGLKAANRPLAASICQVLGLAATVIGLLLTLRPYGIVGAAATTTVAYGVAFFAALYYMRQEEHFSTSEAFSPQGLRTDLASLLARLLARTPFSRRAQVVR